ncbi:alkene reductase [Actinomadura logoneensis]|uniref:Alkene reductase n=1 Tax=Actinomadura logoneensis TaxID=2293572 RepID=A0A372JEH3_9ACTN|nr:alkene reductase [Actinomadura logoneensis]RFU38372.1 alkene reductase [Actinomadura logoneensis]
MLNDTLLSPSRVGLLDLPNRLVMAPMTRNRADADGVPGALMETYYAQRATAGLIIAEAATPNAVGLTYPNIPAIYGPAHVTGWRGVTRAVRDAGGRMFLQIQHGGRVGHPDNSGLHPVAPSPVPLPDTIHTPTGPRPAVVPREMTEDDIRRTVEDFAAAARNAIDAGFDGVEVHSANGYLLHQFLGSNTNLRTDGYGGSVENRVRFTLEVTRAVVDAVGADRVGVRISPAVTANDLREDDTDALYPVLVRGLAEIGPAYLHVVYADPDAAVYQTIRELWPNVLVANPKLDEPTTEEVTAKAERLAEAGADLVALGRPFLANPDLVERLRTGAPLNEIQGRYLMYTGGATGYTDYPSLDPAALAEPRPEPRVAAPLAG